MNLIRKATVAAGSTVLVTIAGAITGIGSATAQAYSVSAAPDFVSVDLTAAETSQLATSPTAVTSMCALVDGKAMTISFIRPPIQFTCEDIMTRCAVAAAGRPATLTFGWVDWECRY
jgi:hypothetical protein